MSMHTEKFCSTLDDLSPIQAIQAIHAALIQLEAAGERPFSPLLGTTLDNGPAIRMLRECLKVAGHFGYREGAA